MLIPGDLTSPERQVWDAIETGRLVSLLQDASEQLDVSGDNEWGDDCTVRAEALAAILTSMQPTKPRRALRLSSARISGVLDLEAFELPCPLIFSHCFFDSALRLSEARLPKLLLVGCHCPELIANQIETVGNVLVINTQTQSVNLIGAHIGGQLSLNGTRLSNPNGNALTADRAQIDQGMFCRDGFRAEGTLRLPGALIGGPLSLSGAQLINPNADALAADRVHIDQGMFCRGGFRSEGELRLLGAHIGGQLSLTGAELTNPNGDALTADGAQINEDVVCEGLRAEGKLRLAGAHIGGQLSLNGAQLTNPNGEALAADGAQIDQDMVCRGGFRAEGELRLVGAHIGGQLLFNGAQLINPGSDAFTADGAQIDQDMVCRGGFRAEGELRLVGAHIGGQLSLNGAQLINPNGEALAADGAQIDQGMFCRDGFRAEGTLRLPGAHIGGPLSLNGAQLINPNGEALAADGAQIDQGMFCRDGFRAEGELSLPGARIGRLFSLGAAQLSNRGGLALNLCRATVAHLLLPINTSPEGTLDLRDARVRHFEDDWPRVSYEAKIGGLAYETISPLERGVSARLEWLENAEGGYLRQPYEQLATILRAVGRDDDARRVGIAKEKSRRHELKWYGRLWSWIYDKTVRYGYQPSRGVLWLFGIFVIGCAVFEWAKAHGDFVVIADKGQRLPTFHGWLYSLDCVLPAVNLGQRAYWSATGAAQYWQAFSILAGWFLVAVILAAVTTRLIRS